MAEPNPLDPTSFPSKTVTLNQGSGHTYHLIDQPPIGYPLTEDTPTVLCCHGFPDLWYGYRYQIVPLAKQGWRVIVPDQIGYGGTDKPAELEAYSMKNISKDLNDLLDHPEVGLKGKKVMLFGHDWGGLVVWRLAQWFPERIVCVLSVCTPPAPPSSSSPDQPFVPLEILVKERLPNFGYQIFFGSGDSPKVLDSAAPHFLSKFFSKQVRENHGKIKDSGEWAKVGRLQPSLEKAKAQNPNLQPDDDDVEFKYYLEEFRKGGFLAPTNWYRTREINWRDDKELPPIFTPTIPCYLLCPTDDPALPISMAKSPAIEAYFPGKNLSMKLLEEGSDHWCLQKPVSVREAINSEVVAFYKAVLGGTWRPGIGPKL